VSPPMTTVWFTLKLEVHVPRAKDGPVVGVAVGGHQPPELEALSSCSTTSSSMRALPACPTPCLCRHGFCSSKEKLRGGEERGC